MRFCIGILLLLYLTVTVKAQTSERDLSCKTIEKLITERFFYSTQLDFSFVDTIIIMDITNTINNCEKVFSVNIDQSLNKSFTYEGVTYQSKLQKTVIIRTEDVIPYPLIGVWDTKKEFSEKYKNYLILERFEEFGNLRLIELFKVLSNHKILLTYMYKDEKLDLIDFEVGQY